MKSIKPSKHVIKYIVISLLLFSVLLGIGIAFLNHLCEKSVESNLEKATKITRAMWNTTTVANFETMQAYYKYYIMDDKVLEFLKMANSMDEESQKIARLKLFRYLWDKYSYLRENLHIRQLHFILPDNRSFLRFHPPSKYGDDLGSYRPSIMEVNRKRKPYIGFEIGRLVSGYRYIFPIFDREGNYLGCVELSRGFETIRKNLNEVDKEAGYIIFLRKSEIDKKIMKEYRDFYVNINGLDGWVVEDPYIKLPDYTKPLPPEYDKVLKSAIKSEEFREMMDSKESYSIALEYMSKYYKITGLKIFEPGKEYHSAVLIAVYPAPDIMLSKVSFNNYKFIYIVMVGIISIYTFLYLLKVYSIRLKNKEIEAITSSMGIGLLVLNSNGVVKYVNRAALDLLGYSEREILGSSLHSLIHSHAGPEEGCPILKAVKFQSVYCADNKFKRKDSSYIDVSVDVRPIVLEGNNVGSIVVFSDISQRKEIENKLFDMATKDSLTGLCNRRFQVEAIKKSKERADRYGIPFSVLMIDIDNFKSINDRFGHNTGDKVLIGVSNVISQSVRSADTLSRWGGEEFLVLLVNTDIEGAVVLAERIRKKVAKLKIEGIPQVTVSIGVAQYIPGESIDNLISRVDNGLYDAKRSGKNRVVRVDI
ncbi:MAG: diguanylate cyclase [Hydrogenothermaceae bacterium]|nr:diguanylate cyclase [Hydrogenothermaceae bacterium]